MKHVLELVKQRQADFTHHPIFRRLERAGTQDEIHAIGPALTFFVMGFQDILRLNEERVDSSELRRVARHHRKEDVGHDRWFLNDMKMVGVDIELSSAFGPDVTAVRDATYALVSEVLVAKHDATRIAILLVLESTGSIFFQLSPTFFSAVPRAGKLLYFSEHHRAVEQRHALFEQELQRTLERVVLGASARAEAEMVAERSFVAMSSIMTHLEGRAEQAARSQGAGRSRRSSPGHAEAR